MKSLSVLVSLLMLLAAGLIVRYAEAPASPVSPAGNPHVVMLVLDNSLSSYAPLWETEIGRRFPNAVGVLCHGTGDIQGEWGVTASKYGRFVSAQTLVAEVRQLYPGRTVVLLACNPGHRQLGVPGVYYATDSVWCVPDRAMKDDAMSRAKLDVILPWMPIVPTTRPAAPEPSRWERDPNVLGNIYEFVAD